MSRTESVSSTPSTRSSTPKAEQSMTAYGYEALAPQIKTTEDMIKTQFEDTKERHALVEKLGELTQHLRANMGQIDWTNNDNRQELIDIARELGVVIPGGENNYKFSKDQVQVILDNIKTKQDALNATNEMDMLRMQRLLNLVNNLVQQLSNLDSKEQRTKEVILQKG